MTEWAAKSLDARAIWQQCGTCSKSYREADRAAHMAKHVDRPREDALTIAEAATALGLGNREARRKVASGELRSFVVPGKGWRCTWILAAEIPRYTAAVLKRDVGAAVQWAKTGTMEAK